MKKSSFFYCEQHSLFLCYILRVNVCPKRIFSISPIIKGNKNLKMILLCYAKKTTIDKCITSNVFLLACCAVAPHDKVKQSRVVKILQKYYYLNFIQYWDWLSPMWLEWYSPWRIDSPTKRKKVYIRSALCTVLWTVIWKLIALHKWNDFWK